MTDLLDPPVARASRPAAPRPRPLAVGAAVAGVAAALVVLLAAQVVALVAWYASDAGAHGSTLDALRVGTDGWLLAHGSRLAVATGGVSATVTALPLGLTLLCAWVAHRCGRWAAATSSAESEPTAAGAGPRPPRAPSPSEAWRWPRVCSPGCTPSSRWSRR